MYSGKERDSEAGLDSYCKQPLNKESGLLQGSARKMVFEEVWPD